MTAINRCAVGIEPRLPGVNYVGPRLSNRRRTPRQPLIDWVRLVSGDHEVRWGANEDGLYLLPEYEDDSEAKVVLEDNYERIFKAELQSWCRDPAL